jgi:hypothetical protein
MIQRFVLLLLALLFVYSQGTDIEQEMFERQRTKVTAGERTLGKTLMGKSANSQWGRKGPRPSGTSGPHSFIKESDKRNWYQANKRSTATEAIQSLVNMKVIDEDSTLEDLLKMLRPSDIYRMKAPIRQAPIRRPPMRRRNRKRL